MKPIEAGCQALIIKGPNMGRAVNVRYCPSEGEIYVIDGEKFMGDQWPNWWHVTANNLRALDTDQKTEILLNSVLVHEKLLMRLDGLTDVEKAEMMKEIADDE